MIQEQKEIDSLKKVKVPVLKKKTVKKTETSLPPSQDNSVPSDPVEQNTVEQEITREQLSLGKRLLSWRTLIPLAIVLIALFVFTRNANIDLAQTWTAIQNANLLFFGLAFCSYYFSFVLRALRWRLLLENVGYTRENGVHLPRFWRLVEIIYISFFANVVVPAKLGDLYRAYLLRQDINVSTTRSFGTVIAERLLDLIVLLLLIIPSILISLHASMPPQLLIGMQVMLGVVIVGIIGLFVLRLAREPIAHLVPKRFKGHYYHFQEGTLGSFKRLPMLSLLTVGVWSCEALRFFFVALSLNLISGSFLHIIAASIFIGLGEALITAVPATGGGVGLVEGGMLAMIALFNPENTTNLSLAAILLDRSISLLSILVIGLIVFLLAFGRKTGREKA